MVAGVVQGSVCSRRANDDQERDLQKREARISDRDFGEGGDGDGFVQRETDDANASQPNTAKLILPVPAPLGGFPGPPSSSCVLQLIPRVRSLPTGIIHRLAPKSNGTLLANPVPFIPLTMRRYSSTSVLVDVFRAPGGPPHQSHPYRVSPLACPCVNAMPLLAYTYSIRPYAKGSPLVFFPGGTPHPFR